MAALIEIGMTLATIAAGFAFGICLAFRLGRRRWGWRERSKPMRSLPREPCWTEAIASDGRYLYGRAQCVNDELIDIDKRWEWDFLSSAGAG